MLCSHLKWGGHSRTRVCSKVTEAPGLGADRAGVADFGEEKVLFSERETTGRNTHDRSC